MLDIEKVKELAQREFYDEKFKAAVAIEKERLKLREQMWFRIWPWRIRIERRDHVKPRLEKMTELLDEMRRDGWQIRPYHIPHQGVAWILEHKIGP